MRHPKNSPALAFAGLFILASAFLPACGKKSVRSDAMAVPTATPVSDTLTLADQTPTSSLPADTGNTQTAMASEPTPTLTPSQYSYVPDSVSMDPDPEAEEAKIKRKNKPAKSLVVADAKPTVEPTPTTAVPTPVPTPVAVAVQAETPPPVEPSASTGGYSWLWWLLLLLAALVGGWYYWNKKKSENTHGLGGSSVRPAPPLGGLSPVSGFFAQRRDLPRVSKKRRKG